MLHEAPCPTILLIPCVCHILKSTLLCPRSIPPWSSRGFGGGCRSQTGIPSVSISELPLQVSKALPFHGPGGLPFLTRHPFQFLPLPVTRLFYVGVGDAKFNVDPHPLRKRQCANVLHGLHGVHPVSVSACACASPHQGFGELRLSLLEACQVSLLFL